MINTSLLTIPNVVIIGAFTVVALIVMGFVSKAAGMKTGDGA